MRVGRLIVVDGIDGSGKATQCKLLADALAREGIAVELISFPQYESSFFGAEVGRYLNGDYGQLQEVHPKLASLLFALDRFEARDRLIEALNAGKMVICDRYTSSNIAHQGARAAAPDRQDLASWIPYVEHKVLNLPRPDLTIFLESTVQSSQTLVGLKEKRTYTDRTHDLHEASEVHLQVALALYRSVAAIEGWQVINCVDVDGIMRTPQDIHAELYSLVIP